MSTGTQLRLPYILATSHKPLLVSCPDQLQQLSLWMVTSEAAGSRAHLVVCPSPLSLPKWDPAGVGVANGLCRASYPGHETGW